MVSRNAELYQETSLKLLNCDVIVGMAVAMIVASRATRNVVVQSETKIRTSGMPLGYFVSSVVTSNFSGGVDGAGLGLVGFQDSTTVLLEPP